MKENITEGTNSDKETVEDPKIKLLSFKLGDNFSNFITDVLTERINNLDYYEALEFLEAAGVGKNEALGVLFGDYEITNNEEEIIIVDNYGDNKFNLYKPLEKFTNDYLSKYRGILENTCNILYRHQTTFINFYDADDEDLTILNKYFPVSLDYIMNPGSNGGVRINSVVFYSSLYKSYVNGEYPELLKALEVSVIKKELISSCEYYFDAMKILDVWYKVKKCLIFLESYYDKNSLFLNSISGIREAFEQTYELITDEHSFYMFGSGRVQRGPILYPF